MKLSHQHSELGIAGYLKNPVTGEMLHFNLLKGQRRVYVQAVIGDKHLEGHLTFEPIMTDDPADDIDMQLRLEIPSGPIGEDLDVKPLRPAADRYDVDGMPMIDGPVRAQEDEGDIKEEGPDRILEPLRDERERQREAADDASRQATATALSSDVDGAPMLGEKTPPAQAPSVQPPVVTDPTAVPEGPKLGYQQDPKRHEDEWETNQRKLDERRAAVDESLLTGKKEKGKPKAAKSA
jgi:hypothetical protein